MSGALAPGMEGPGGGIPREADAEAMARLSEVCRIPCIRPRFHPSAGRGRGAIRAELEREEATRADEQATAEGARKIGPPAPGTAVRRHRGRRRGPAPASGGGELRPQGGGGSLVTCLLHGRHRFALSHATFPVRRQSAAPRDQNSVAGSSDRGRGGGESSAAGGAERPAAAAPGRRRGLAFVVYASRYKV